MLESASMGLVHKWITAIYRHCAYSTLKVGPTGRQACCLEGNNCYGSIISRVRAKIFVDYSITRGTRKSFLCFFSFFLRTKVRVINPQFSLTKSAGQFLGAQTGAVRLRHFLIFSILV